jgi:putative transposase
MRNSRFTEEQIIKVLKEHAAGLSAGELCRKYGVSDATFYKWRSRYGAMEISDARKLKSLEDENRKLKKLLAESVMDAATLRHTCGTMLLQLGVSVYDVAGVIGTTEDVVRRTYGHHAHDHLRQAVAVFSRRPTPKNSP